MASCPRVPQGRLSFPLLCESRASLGEVGGREPLQRAERKWSLVSCLSGTLPACVPQ